MHCRTVGRIVGKRLGELGDGRIILSARLVRAVEIERAVAVLAAAQERGGRAAVDLRD